MLTDLHLCDLCIRSYAESTVDSGIAHALITEAAGFTVVAFRGTGSVTDALVDGDAAAWFSWPLGVVHRGFLMSMLSIARQVHSKLGNGGVIVTGHSKGGAEALLFSAWLAHLGRKPVQCTTFGAPRVAHWLNFGMLSLALAGIGGTDYRNGDDPVTLVPTWFHHPRKKKQLGKTLADWKVVSDHKMANYREWFTGMSV